MKTYNKILIALIVAICGMGVANAQFRFGVKAGLNLNSLSLNSDWKKSFEKDNNCGYTVGVMTEFTVPVVGIAADLSLMYTRMNSNLEDAEDHEKERFSKNFLEIPLNLKYKIGLPLVGNIITPYVLTGPSFAIKLDKNSIDYVKTKTCQVAWNVGVGVELIKHLQITGSYGFGINNIVKLTGVVDTEKVKIKNNYWTVTAAWLF